MTNRVVKSVKQLAVETGCNGLGADYAAAFGRLSAVVETFLWLADDCNNLEQLQKYVKEVFESVTETSDCNNRRVR